MQFTEMHFYIHDESPAYSDPSINRATDSVESRSQKWNYFWPFFGKFQRKKYNQTVFSSSLAFNPSAFIDQNTDD